MGFYGNLVGTEVHTEAVENIVPVVEDTFDAEELAVLEAMGMYNVLNEASFSFMPRFKQYPELAKMYDSIEDAEDLLNSKGEVTKTGVQKVCKIALRILDIWYNVESVITLPMCILILPIPLHLMYRAIEWAIKIGEEAVAANEGRKIVAQLEKIKANTKDAKQKEEIQKKIDKINDRMKKMQGRDKKKDNDED